MLLCLAGLLDYIFAFDDMCSGASVMQSNSNGEMSCDQPRSQHFVREVIHDGCSRIRFERQFPDGSSLMLLASFHSHFILVGTGRYRPVPLSLRAKRTVRAVSRDSVTGLCRNRLCHWNSVTGLCRNRPSWASANNVLSKAEKRKSVVDR